MDDSGSTGAGLRSTRRTVVRAAAWSAPAVVVAATAPPAMAASGLVLEVQDGATGVVVANNNVTDYGAALTFSGFTVTPTGGALQPGQLIVTVTFDPSAPSDEDLLDSFRQSKNGWQFPAGANVNEVSLVYADAATAGQPTGSISGQIFCTKPVNDQPGSFVVSVSAPSAGFVAPVVRTFPVPLPTLNVELGQTYTEAAVDDERCQLVFDGLGIGISDGELSAGQLTLTVGFDPTAPSTKATLDPLNKNADPWDYDRTASNVPAVVFTYQQGLASNAETAEFPFGPYLQTEFPAADQPGSFVLTASAPGYASASAEVVANAGGELVFDSGTSYVAPAIDGGWQVSFDDARVSPAPPYPTALGPLTMVASFEATGGFTNQMASTVPVDGMPGWTPPAQGATGTSLTYTTTDALTQGSPTVIPDGGVFRNNSTNPGSRGTFKLDFSAPGQHPTSHTYDAPPPYITATFDPNGNHVRAGLDPGGLSGYSYVWSGNSKLRVQGGSLPTNALAMTVTFEPTPPSSSRRLWFYASPFSGWSQTLTQFQTSATSHQYVYLSPVADGSLLTISPDDVLFSTLGQVPGAFVLTFSSVITTTPAFRPVVVRVPTAGASSA